MSRAYLENDEVVYVVSRERPINGWEALLAVVVGVALALVGIVVWVVLR
jgi:hypothetical protein